MVGFKWHEIIKKKYKDVVTWRVRSRALPIYCISELYLGSKYTISIYIYILVAYFQLAFVCLKHRLLDRNEMQQNERRMLFVMAPVLTPLGHLSLRNLFCTHAHHGISFYMSGSNTRIVHTIGVWLQDI